MTEEDRAYYRMRAAQEESAACASDHDGIASIHRALAVRYLAKSMPDMPSRKLKVIPG